MTLRIAVEGPSYSGKSTLVSALGKIVHFPMLTFPCYADTVHPELPQAPAANAREQLRAFNILLDLDKDRYLTLQRSQAGAKLVLLDRSVHTLLAHNLATEVTQGWKIFQAALNLALSRQQLLWPEVIIYIDVPQSVLQSRYPVTPIPEERFFIDPEYNKNYKSYFFPGARCQKNVVAEYILDGSCNPAALANLARRILEDHSAPND